MILPLFMVLASLGGLTAGYIRLKKSKALNKLHISVAIVLPLVISPVEQIIGPSLSLFQARTSIVIDAPLETIWNNITKVREITKSEDKSSFNKWLGIPRPIRAELNYLGVNAERKAIFTGGLVFTEIVSVYKHQELMEFSIKPNTGEIPSTTFDEHVLIGGKYFDVLKGSYKVDKLGSNKYRVRLDSTFEVNTTFNFYAGMWARWIMTDIQNNILNIIKERCET